MSSTVQAPYQTMVAVTPNDSTSVVDNDGIIITAAGNFALTDGSGNNVTITGGLVGSIIPVKIALVKATGTTGSCALVKR